MATRGLSLAVLRGMSDKHRFRLDVLALMLTRAGDLKLHSLRIPGSERGSGRGSAAMLTSMDCGSSFLPPARVTMGRRLALVSCAFTGASVLSKTRGQRRNVP